LVGYGIPELEAKQYEGKVKSGSAKREGLAIGFLDASEHAPVKESRLK
jgi:hypothetical protein